MNFDKSIEMKQGFLLLYLALAYITGAVLSWVGLIIISIFSIIYYIQKEKEVKPVGYKRVD